MSNFSNELNKACTDPARRHDFIIMFDVENGNPNGDPDMDNQPRVDQETNHGIVTDVCLKRKVRNYIALTEDDKTPYKIYVQDKGIYLNDLHKEAQVSVGIPADKAKNPDRGKRDEARDWMCANYFDVRMFGAVMSTGVNAGQVRGPVQLTFARSIDPILPMDVTITRLALTDEKEKAKADKVPEAVSAEDDVVAERFARSGTFGRKAIVPYGLYIGHGFFSAPFAQQTKVNEGDVERLWKSLASMFDLDRSASRGFMSCRGLHVFSHNDKLGNAPAHKLFEKLEVRRKTSVSTARSFGDYVVTLNREMPEGVTLTSLVEG